MLEESQIKILMKLHELEQSLAAMYALFSEKFPENRHLWSVLVKEEMEHAEAVQKLYRLTYKKAVAFSEGSVRLPAIEAIIDFVHKNCEIGRRDGLNAVHALELSRDVEKSMIARDIFNHFKVRMEYVNLLQYLRESSEQHARMVQEELDRHSKRQSTKKA